MDAFSRGRRQLLTKRPIAGYFALGAAVIAACGHGRATPVGVSSGGALGAGGDADAGPGPARAEPSAPSRAAVLPAGYAATYRRVGRAGAPTLGHAVGRYTVDVWASPGAETPRGPYAEGATFIAEHHERSGAAGPVLMMRKMPSGFDAAHGDWRYVAVDATSAVALNGGASTEDAAKRCAACHDDAPRDRIFLVAP